VAPFKLLERQQTTGAMKTSSNEQVTEQTLWPSESMLEESSVATAAANDMEAAVEIPLHSWAWVSERVPTWDSWRNGGGGAKFPR
jgi:hypothetical protein